MAQPHETQQKETEPDRQLRRFYQRIVDQAVPSRFQTLFSKLREQEKELEHEG